MTREGAAWSGQAAYDTAVGTPATLRFAQGGQGAYATVSGLTPPVALIRPVLACPRNL
ncbi:hypothetical protein [Candidatus Chloroploca sp. Khr17]|uniref:hypothetical protein n=1 Tax=Candidatus Chloroploca sp. Khr17 TaxID=2496869 RepID=UPI0013EC3DE4|nr:hypothetical protein [Candidatus Chloroploca sp. Khr17]